MAPVGTMDLAVETTDLEAEMMIGVATMIVATMIVVVTMITTTVENMEMAVIMEAMTMLGETTRIAVNLVVSRVVMAHQVVMVTNLEKVAEELMDLAVSVDLESVDLESVVLTALAMAQTPTTTHSIESYMLPVRSATLRDQGQAMECITGTTTRKTCLLLLETANQRSKELS